MEVDAELPEENLESGEGDQNQDVSPIAKVPADDEQLDFEEDEGEVVSDDETKETSGEPKNGEEVGSNKGGDEEGELNTDEELEDGEVKDDDDDDPQPEQKQRSICRFFGAGKCTWGDNCRFYHEMPEKGKVNPQQRNFPNYGRNPPARHPPLRGPEYYPTPMPAIPPLVHPPIIQPLHPAESSWDRGVRNARDLVEKATMRRDHEADNEKRPGPNREPEQHGGRVPQNYSRSPSPHRGRSPSPQRRREGNWDSEYERRHRLAFQSAPWNDGQSPPRQERNREAAERYSDPWERNPVRRDKDPARKKGPGSSNLSSSDSESSGSFSDGGKPRPRQAPRVDRRPPPRDVLPRGTQPDVSRLPRIPKINRSKESSSRYDDNSRLSGGRRSEARRDARDSWSDSSSDSLSDSGSDEYGRRRRLDRHASERRGNKEKRKAEQASTEPHSDRKYRKSSESYSRASASPPPVRSPARHSPVSDSQNSKNPGFSMKFSKKINVLKQSDAAVKLNGQGSPSEDDVISQGELSNPSSPKDDEGSLSPTSRDLQASRYEMNKLLSETAEVSSTTESNSTRRNVLLKQLKDIEAAIARKKKSTA
ncbi:Zinc finger CCCH domain-containing protein 18 [Halotydeus destructor]|nr:Zinc finger CCCH domain-containing protein 18 [Halotydeus destructor]